jgi:cell fate regulator YaaT (PSP1 superfamily)
MPQTIEVRFKGTRRAFFRWPQDDEPLRLEEVVVVPVERGLDLGRVSAVGAVAEKKCGGCSTCGPGDAPATAVAAATSQLPTVVRRAAPEEVKAGRELRLAEEEDRRRVVQKVREHKLDMKVSDLEWQWDRQRLTIYFTAEQRVDFRALVRDLASAFRTRIELRQIGVRDEAARIGGVGRCGKEFCCSTWLTELSPVNLSLAKDQHLSLNPSQISGGCGRLLCCLKYEHAFYAAQRKRFPREGKTITTLRGGERVVAVDIFRERVFLRGPEEARVLPLVELQAEMEQAAQAGGSAAVETAAPAPPKRPAPPARPARERAPAPAAQQPPAAPASPPDPPTAEAAEGAEGPAKKKRRRRRRRGPRADGGAPPTPES